MIDVKVGGSERQANRPGDVEESWVTQHLIPRQVRGSVCVIVRIDAPAVNLELATPSCAPGGGGTRGLRDDEQRIVDLWQECRLNTNDFAPGNVITFLKRLDKIL